MRGYWQWGVTGNGGLLAMGGYWQWGVTGNGGLLAMRGYWQWWVTGNEGLLSVIVAARIHMDQYPGQFDPKIFLNCYKTDLCQTIAFVSVLY